MKRYLRALAHAVSVGALVCLCSLCIAGDSFFYYAHDLPPFAHEEGGHLDGFAIALVRDICDRRGLCAQIEMFPFKRALLTVSAENPQNSFLLLARCPDREADFKWVGPVFKSQVFFYVRRDLRPKANTLADLHDVAIGVHRGNRDHSVLQAMGFTNLNASDTQTQTLKMLAAGRVDATPMSEAVFPTAARDAGLNPDLFERSEVQLYTSELYFGFSTRTTDSVVEAWRNALATARTTGRYDAIHRQYFPGRPPEPPK